MVFLLSTDTTSKGIHTYTRQSNKKLNISMRALKLELYSLYGQLQHACFKPALMTDYCISFLFPLNSLVERRKLNCVVKKAPSALA